jgi:hypothetical protein
MQPRNLNSEGTNISQTAKCMGVKILTAVLKEENKFWMWRTKLPL